MSPLSEKFDALLGGALPSGSLFAVGGRVRDELRIRAHGAQIEIKDLDYVIVGVALEKVIARLQPLGRTDVVGAAFAVVKLTVDGTTVDVALPRRETSTGIGHRDFDVQSGPDVPLEDDLARRDFRMNMIARAIPGGELVDPYNGAADIAARRIDILREGAFAEDPLRLLRACQFAARFGYAPTEQTLAAMRAAAPRVISVSPERIGEELTKLFALAPTPSIGVELMRTSGVLGHIWPEVLEGVGVEQNEWHVHDVYRHNLATLDAVPPGDITLRLAALLHDVGKPRTKDGPHFYRHEQVGEDLSRDMLGRVRFSNEVTETVAHLVRQHMYSADPELSDAAVRRFIRRIGPDSLERLFALREADVVGSGLPRRDGSNAAFEERTKAMLAQKPPFSVRDLSIGGAAIMELMRQLKLVQGEFRGDARVGSTLAFLLDRVVDDPALNEPAALLALARERLTGEVSR